MILRNYSAMNEQNGMLCKSFPRLRNKLDGRSVGFQQVLTFSPGKRWRMKFSMSLIQIREIPGALLAVKWIPSPDPVALTTYTIFDEPSYARFYG